MSKRKYTHIKTAEALILSMRQEGMTLQEFADELGLRLKQTKNWSYRHNCEKQNLLKGIVPSPKGRPRKMDSRQNRISRRNLLDFGWKTSCCGIFCSSQKEVRLRAKCHVIYMNRECYPVSVMCRFFEVSRRGYYNSVRRLGHKEKDASLAEIIREKQNLCFKTYGYRRMWMESQGIQHNPRTILIDERSIIP